MGCGQNLIFTGRHSRLSIFMLFLLILCSTHFRLIAQGRPVPQSQEEMAMAMARRQQIGSRPPRCEKKCTSCGHCEAVQVPTNPNIKNGTIVATIAHSRGDDYTNYKPMSWKCKCGNFFFNP